MNKIYVPDIENYQCFVVNSSESIRAYKDVPELGSNVEYRDYFVNSNYLFQDGYELIESVPICLNNEMVTNDFYYRNDLDKILIIFLILAFIIVYIPIKILFRIFKKRRIVWVKIKNIK